MNNFIVDNDRAIHVVYVEDDSEDVYIVMQYFKREEKRRYCLHNLAKIEDVSVLLEHNSVDLILLDLNLGNMEGLSTFLRCKELVEDTPIVVLTGLDDEAYGDSLIQLGAMDFLPKQDLNQRLLMRTIRFAIERNELFSSLADCANKDELTLLCNRRALKDAINRHHLASQQRIAPYAIMMIDLNDFKPINDTFGHHAGDMVLRQVATRLKQHCRKQDVVARIGGDEFAVFLPRYETLNEVNEIAERLIKAIETDCLVAKEGTIHKLKVKAALGIALFPEHAQDIDTLLKCADQAMYSGKQHGKESVVSIFR